MQINLSALLAALRLSVADPRQIARLLISLRLPPVVGWTALALVVVLSALLSAVAYLVFPAAMDPAMAAVFASGFELLLMQGMVMAVTLMLVQGVGRSFGGTGRFSDALVLMAWIEGVLVLLQAVQMVLLLLAPPLAEALGLIGIALFLWLLTNFVAELHGFRSAAKVFFTILGTVLALSFAAAFVMLGTIGG
jgi:hypothetical protein